MITPILQFGTSRFLQAHADLFLSEALARGQAIGPVTVVQSSGAAERQGRLAALAAPVGFPVRIQGIEAGQRIDREIRVTSVVRALSTATDWPEILRIGAEEARVILSNTSDTGFAPAPADTADTFDQSMSFPAKLTHLLRHRFRAGGAPVQVMPAELIPDNGRVLRDRVLDLAGDPAFADWLTGSVTWVNSLVDRIVSAPLDPAGAVAEPYALWAIEDQPGLLLPCQHPAIEVYPSLDRPAALKLFILNLGHTMLAESWLKAGAPDGRLVREALADPAGRAALGSLYRDEILPGFTAAGFGPEAAAYAAATIERFDNPFLDHRLSDIAQNHAEKIRRRGQGFLDWAAARGDNGPKPRLAALVAQA